MYRSVLLTAFLLSSACATAPTPRPCNESLRTSALVAAGVTAVGLGLAFVRPEIGVPMPVIGFGTAGAAAVSGVLYGLSGCRR